MVLTAGDLAAEAIAVPLLVGGAALTRRFTHGKIAPAYGGAFCTYAKDAMDGLSLVERLTSPEGRETLAREVAETAERDRAKQAEEAERRAMGAAGNGASSASAAPAGPSASVRRDLEPPPPPDLERHVEELPLREVWELVNPQMLYAKHLGLKGSIDKLREAGDEKLAMLERVIGEIQEEVLEEAEAARASGGDALGARAVWRFYPASAEGDRLVLRDPQAPPTGGGDPAAEWSLPRQEDGDRLCLSDYVLSGSGGGDHVALFVTTFGVRTGEGNGGAPGVRERAERWRREGEYLKSHAFAALALETAEAAAELVHRRLRAAWGFPDPDDLPLRRLFSARYRGKRYSFGYPACPDLGGQRELFAALRPEEIGVELTEGDMMDPEASVSALVFHHPDAKYFSV
jgi:5-methyltetrahydrofolate--homocysteine methyltransferase